MNRLPEYLALVSLFFVLTLIGIGLIAYWALAGAEGRVLVAGVALAFFGLVLGGVSESTGGSQ